MRIGQPTIEHVDVLNSLVMIQADRIRQFALDHYISPARAEGRAEITVRAGDIHRRMGLSNALPAVCSAIGGRKFSELARVSLRDRTGPANGANVYFNFGFSERPTLTRRTVALRETVAKSGQAWLRSDLDLGDALGRPRLCRSSPRELWQHLN